MTPGQRQEFEVRNAPQGQHEAKYGGRSARGPCCTHVGTRTDAGGQKVAFRAGDEPTWKSTMNPWRQCGFRCECEPPEAWMKAKDGGQMNTLLSSSLRGDDDRRHELNEL